MVNLIPKFASTVTYVLIIIDECDYGTANCSRLCTDRGAERRCTCDYGFSFNTSLAKCHGKESIC